jgi:hypothetical protein
MNLACQVRVGLAEHMRLRPVSFLINSREMHTKESNSRQLVLIGVNINMSSQAERERVDSRTIPERNIEVFTLAHFSSGIEIDR